MRMQSLSFSAATTERRGSAKTVDSVYVIGKVPGGSNHTVAWYSVHRSVYRARVNLVFGVMGVYAVTGECVNHAHIVCATCRVRPVRRASTSLIAHFREWLDY